ncbi:amino acid adenylation domain-containing protein [Kordia periserrulae]|uniref:Amino acid adenylation domain-containing protein n=1 Tax=Kordia periserrulae TaxID=701523 RepID=A0A2T6BZ86_9FLAO|nr:non-ribosomal peptide synthetase [Kordia periserrulae]PTX61382.1 amino acid adenylation domain-containing protein [Kordia periserrulae]
MKLTLPQQDVYFEQLLYPNEPIYNIGAKIAIEGNLVYELLNEAYIALINQHDAYRSQLTANYDNVEITTIATFDKALDYLDFSHENNALAAAETYMEKDFQVAFQLENDENLHKFVLLKVREDFHYLYSKYHHIITDGWGTSLMFQRLVANYNELVEVGKIQSEYPFQYADFAENDTAYATSEAYKNDETYWKQKFEHLPDTLLKKIDENVTINKSKRKELYIKREVYNELIEISKACGSSTFHFILGILYVYFSKRFQKEELVIGVPVLNRGSAKFKKTVGLFMGVSALKVHIDSEATFDEFLTQIKQQLRADYRHQRFPLGKLINRLNLATQNRELFNITLSYEKQDYAPNFLHTKTSVIPMTHESERVGLALYIREFDEKEDVKIDFDYNLNYFSESEITRVVTHFENLLDDVKNNPTKKIAAYEYVSDTEKKQVVQAFNNTYKKLDTSTTLITKIDKNAVTQADNIAIKDFAISYTYEQVFDKTNAIAAYLQAQTKENTPIGVLMERSADMIVILLGILKSGRSYIPLDPNFPKERLEYIIEASELQTIIGSSNTLISLSEQTKFIEATLVLQLPTEATTLPTVSQEDTAYIIYTSGSTGKPKGVEIGHRSLLNFLTSMQESIEITSVDTLYSVTTPSFDISILEFFAPLISGATVYVANQETLQNPKRIIEELETVAPTLMQATPSFYQMLFNEGWEGNNNLKILCGGDLLSEALTEKLLAATHSLWNMYGPTETTIWSSTKRIHKASEASNIGKPIQNTSFYILDKHQNVLPVNTEGKLYIGGEGLAKGYYKASDLTNQKFIQNPFKTTEKIYDTGDVGKWNEAGEIVFLGRDDLQVKIRGFRIELGDIEAQLNKHEKVNEAVVIAKKEANQSAFLVAYIIPTEETIDTAEIINFLKQKLPAYMIPYTLITVTDFPLTPNKKIDRKQLTQRDIVSAKTTKNVHVAQNDMQKTLYTFYQKALQTQEDFDISESFFALGGHSLNAVRLIGYIEKEFHYRVSLKDLFEHSDILSLAEYLQQKDLSNSIEIVPVATQPYYPITFPQYAIWLASLQPEKSVAYNMFGAYEIQGTLDKSIMLEVFLDTIERYEILRTNFIEVDGVAYQKVKSSDEISFEIEEFYATTATYDEQLSEFSNKEFDMENDMLVRLAIFHVEDGVDMLVFATHHVIMDGWSLELMIKEITDRYTANVHKTALDLPTLHYQFRDYVVWQNAHEARNEARNSAFWTNYLQGYQWKSLLPYDTEFAEDKYTGEFYLFNWEASFLNELNNIAVQNKVTLHTLLMTSFHVLLYKMYGIDDICLGTINSGRTSFGLNDHIGMFVKTLPLRSKINPEENFLTTVLNMHQNLLQVDEHQDIPEEVLNTLRLEAILVLQNQTFNYGKIDVTDELTLKTSPVIAKYNRLPMLLDFALSDDYLRGSILYDTSKYHRETMDILIMKYEKFLKEIIQNINQTIDTINIDVAFEAQEAIDIDFNF